MKRIFRLSSLLRCGILALAAAAQDTPTTSDRDAPSYGADVSWPTQHDNAHSILNGPLPHQLDTYRAFMAGCYERYSRVTCDRNDLDRLAYNLNQPPQQRNFTSAGYAKVAAPPQTYAILRDYWNQFNATNRNRPEAWDDASVYVNHWAVPTSVLPLELPPPQRQLLWDQLRAVLEQWTRTSLVPASLYGIRTYRRGAVLAPHVDRLPLVVSAVLNVAQAVAAPWPLEVLGRDGRARNLTLAPGEMVLYESHAVVHGRPFPLDGDYYANVFVHFEPLHYTRELDQRLRRQQQQQQQQQPDQGRSPKKLFEAALARVMDGSASPKAATGATSSWQSQLPHFIAPDSPEARRWRQEFVFYREHRSHDKRPPTTSKARVKGVTPAHVKAANGSVEDMKKIHDADPAALHAADGNGWKPLHEAARGGNTEVVVYLLRKGADVNERTNEGKGANALWWAKQALDEDHPVIRLLERNGGIAIGPNE